MKLMHMDMSGPMQEASLRGVRHFAAVLDDSSKLSIVQCVAFKADAPSTSIFNSALDASISRRKS
jgi:hypothetical protein